MPIFEKMQQEQALFQEFTTKLDESTNRLSQHAVAEDISSIKKINDNFSRKTNDFYREDRKLNIGVIGQVKAGKSSFLNTMIFDGMEILPKASTPKTATLTKIEYSEMNCIAIEYYTVDEWKSLEEKATVDSNLSEYVVAKEIMAMVRKNNINPYSYLEKGKDSIDFHSYSDLMNELNTYVGEDGIVTPLVKSVTLHIDKQELKEISIVDTPGLNDPIASRTDKTKQFIEMCDVVFFLSRASGFLDKSDVDLLTAQLPQKGVKRLVLICSRYDDGINDTLFDKGGLKQADVDTKIRLKRHAAQIFGKVIENYQNRGISGDLINLITECKTPIFVSAMAHNMCSKSQSEYNSEEENVYNNLNIFEELNEDLLRKIGNIDKVKEIFKEVILEKEDTLLKKSASFIPDTLREVEHALMTMKQTTEKRVNLLSNNDKEQLDQQKKYITTQINTISANIEGIFGEMNIKLEQSKAEALRNLRESSREYSTLSEKTGTITHYKSYRVSNFKLFSPSTWGTSRTEHYSYDERYYYLDVSDALENIRTFANEATNSIENMFYESIDIATLKRRLLKVIVENFDASNENYDPAYFKLLAEKTLNDIELPVIKIDVSTFLSDISSKFSGEIQNSSDKSNLKSLLATSIGKLFDEITENFITELKSFKGKLEPIKLGFSDKLLENINKEFNLILEQFENKEAEIQKGQNLLLEINQIIKDLQ